MSLFGRDPASTYYKVVLYDRNHSSIPTYTGSGLNSSMYTNTIPINGSFNLTSINSNPLGTNPPRSKYLIGGQIYTGTPITNSGYTITSDGLTHSYLINFNIIGRFTDNPNQLNRLWIQPTFNGNYDNGIIGPGGIELFGLANDSSSLKIRSLNNQLYYIYATNSTSWKLDFLLSEMLYNPHPAGPNADDFTIDRAWFTIKTLF